jgi:hypothetical protein
VNPTLDAPSLIQFACERCKTKFVLPPSSRRLSPVGRIRATGTALGRAVRLREGFGSAYDAARRQILAKMDDDAYQSFVQSFKFCHECRQFVCSECWSNSRKTCLGCFAKAAGTTIRQKPPFAPEGPSIPRPTVLGTPKAARRRRLRTEAGLLVMAAAIILLAVDLVVILPGSSAGAGATKSVPAIADGTPTEVVTATPVDTPTEAPSDTPSPSPSASSSPSPSPSESPSETPTAAGPTATPRPATPRPPTPTPKPSFPNPVIKCNGHTDWVEGTAPLAVTCTYTNPPASYTYQWYRGGGKVSGSATSYSYTFDSGTSSIYIKVTAYGNTKNSNNVQINAT